MTDAPALKLKRIYLDTNAFIEAFEHNTPVSTLLRQLLLSEPRDGKPILVTSQLTLAELLVKPFEEGRSDLVEVYENWTSTNPYIEGVPLVRAVLRDAAARRAANKSLKLPDAIHITTAIGTGCSHFVSNDDQLKNVPELFFVRLTEEEVGGLLGLLAHG
jgi:predicted nucleic acid-binding protein